MSNIKRILNILLSILLILLPCLLLVVYSLRLNTNLFYSYPVWNDEYTYWREMFSFNQNIFNFGDYYWANYPPASIGSFYCHGVSPLIAWGWYALTFQWSSNSIVVSNLIIMTVSLLVFVLCYKPKNCDLLLCILFMLCFRPFSMYISRSMLEIPCYAYLIIYFSFFILLFRRRKNIYFVACIISWIIVTLIRPCYAIVLLPAIIVKCDYKVSKKLFSYLVAYCLCFAILYFFYCKTCAVYPGNFMSSLQNYNELDSFFKSFINHFLSNFRSYFSFTMNNVTLNEIIIRYLSILLITCGILLPNTLYKSKPFDVKILSYCFSLLLLVLVLANMFLYDVFDMRDFRVLSPLVFVISFYQLLNIYHFVNNKKQIIIFPMILLSIIYLYRPSSYCNTHVYDSYKKIKYTSFFDSANISNSPQTSVAISFESIMKDDGYYWLSSIPSKCSVVYLRGDQNIDDFSFDFYYDSNEDNKEMINYDLLIKQNGIGCLYGKH